MRAERLVALLFTLQSKRSATAAELADALGVSERTMHRDLSALRESGVPLWTEPGRHGGVRLVEGWRARLDGLTGREAVALFALGVPDALAGLGLGTAVSAAQAKVAASLPKDLRDQAERVAGRFHLDAPGWFSGEDEASELATVARAVWAQHRLNVRYQRRDKIAERLLEPLGLVLKAGVWYLVARVPEDDALRTYRVSRIESADELEHRFERPRGFQLAAWWREASAQFEQLPMRQPVKVRITEAGLRRLAQVLGPEYRMKSILSAGQPDADGWVEAELALESRDVGLGQLTALGASVEILEPADLRAALAEIGTAVAARNAPR